MLIGFFYFYFSLIIIFVPCAYLLTKLAAHYTVRF